MVAYRTNGAPVGTRPIAKRLLTTRPYQTVSVGILAGDTLDIRRCLASVWPIADEILLGDTGGALRVLRRSIEDGFFCYPYFVRDPLLDSIRSVPEFQSLLERARERHEAFRRRFF